MNYEKMRPLIIAICAVIIIAVAVLLFDMTEKQVEKKKSRCYTVTLADGTVYEHVTNFQVPDKSRFPYFSGNVNGENLIFSTILKYEEE